MDPVSLVIGIWISGFVVREVGGDLMADIKGRERPSQLRARQRHERRLARGEQPNPTTNYLRRIVDNATERWADRADQKHRAKRAWIEEQEGTRSAKWLDRKRKRADRYESAAQAVADRAGVLWGKTKDTVEQARQRRAEDAAHRRNQAEPDLRDRDDANPEGPAPAVDSGEEDDDRPLADVLAFTRPGLDQSPQQPTGEGEYSPLVLATGDEVSGGIQLAVRRAGPDDELQSEGPQLTGDPQDPSTWQGVDRYGRDIQTGRGESFVDEYGVVHDSDEYLLGDAISPERRVVQQHQRQHNEEDTTDNADPNPTETTEESMTDPEHERVHDPDRFGSSVSVAELQRRRQAQNDELARRHETAQTQAQHDHEYRMAQLAQQHSHTDPDTTASTDAEEALSMTEPTANAAAENASYETTNLTTTLARTQASVDACTNQMSVWDQRKTDLDGEAKALATQIAGIETQIAALQSRGNAGEEIARLRSAQEQLTAAREAVAEQAETAASVLEAYQTAGSEFGQAHAGFQQQITGQEFYAAHDGAGDKDFLTTG